MDKSIYKSITVFKEFCIHPILSFSKFPQNKNDKYAFCFFITGLFIAFVKSFFVRRSNITYFENEAMNCFLTFIGIPQIQFVIIIISFILFITLLKYFCKYTNIVCNKEYLVKYIMFISCYGILFQMVFPILSLILYKNVIQLLTYIIFIWIIFMSIFAVKESQKISFFKAFIIYLFSGIPVVFLSGLTGLAPYLAWMTYPINP